MDTALEVRRELPMVDQSMLDALGMTQEQLSGMSGVMGMENSRPEDFQIPRLQITQALSPQLMRTKPEFIPGLQVGQYFNTVTKEVYGDRLLVLPIKFSVSRLRFVNGALDCQSKNGIDGGKQSPTCKTCKLKEWGTGLNGIGTDCKEYRNWLLVDAETLSMPMSFSFKSSSLIVSKNWRTLLESRMWVLPNGEKKQAPPFATVYAMRTAEKQGPKGTYYVPVVDTFEPSNAVHLKHCKGVQDSFKGDLASDASAGDE